jgi:predicted benzoate:H+ symporter BenE
LFGLGAAFWGLVAGFVALAVKALLTKHIQKQQTT